MIYMLLSATSVYAIGALTASSFRTSATIVTGTMFVTNAFQGGSATNVKILFVAAVARFQNANCANRDAAVTVIHQGSGVEMKGMDTVQNVLVNRLKICHLSGIIYYKLWICYR